ncbi:hypothetical protein EJ08DRAFT_672882 [Tothia fuscella]|uniref:Non-specific serine/threonine protein kinase n=1 Tax=Tothia fuscella TaxID=1048955 RepID=A0A9P4NHJ6_9PEZI|nr:hypothetical protein EJ08DRAFT_672882 [Tothia fuscella]
MADNEDLIDFGVIETQKENIQSLPGGRSAKSLASIMSPLATKNSPLLSDSQNIRDTIRREYEKELLAIAESDDPLDLYDRYIKWTMDAYPTAQATAESNLLPLLERATKAFLASSHYKNDPRYLKMWLLYIRLFSDAPRETYAFIARHDVGESLALFYEEFAAWLESVGRWMQAEEVYLSGIDREARPTERLIRKFGEFQHRRDTQAQQQGGPTSPALPKVRPALAAKVDPFAGGSAEESDPQAGDRAAASRPTKPGRAKLAIFADGDGPPNPGSSEGNQGWDSIGSIGERKKENTHEARPWAGETLNGGKRAASGPKLMIFKDTTLAASANEHDANSILAQQFTVNPKTGRREVIVVDLEAIYPDGDYKSGREFCLEEIRALRRGLLDRNWRKESIRTTKVFVDAVTKPRPLNPDMDILSPRAQETPSQVPIAPVFEVANRPVKIPIFDDQEPALPEQSHSTKPVKRTRREDRANRTQKIQVLEVKAEPQTTTVQTNLASPTGPKIKRKKSAEATMTFHTKEAMNEVYDLFNQTLSKVSEAGSEGPDSQSEDDDDDYTSAGESTGTGRISGTTSEYGEDTQADFTESRTSQSIAESNEGDDTNTNGSGWSEFTQVKDVPDGAVSLEDEGIDNDYDEITTPTSPNGDPSQSESHPLDNEDSEVVTLAHRPFPRGQNRLPFMTPIVEKTESSVGAMSSFAEKDYFTSKTPSRTSAKTPTIPEYNKNNLWSSPFQEVTNTNLIDKENAPVPQPKLAKPNKKAPLGSTVPLGIKQTLRENPKGPIIKDAQCNPIDESIRQTILSDVQPPVSSYTGYFDWRGKTFGKGNEIRKHCKALKSKGEKTMGLTMPPTLRFEGSERCYTVKRELGKGAFAPVYLVENSMTPAGEEEKDKPVKMGEGEFGVKRQNLEAIKMEDPPSPWEFYLLRQAKRRLGVSRPSDSIVEAYEMHLFDDECYLIEEFRDQGTLLDSVNLCRADVSGGGTMDEQLVMFFTIELFRTVEALHDKGLIHGDLKADNVLVRLNNLSLEKTWAPQYTRDGTSGWCGKGITLIDFGRGIDVKAFRPDAQFIADWKTSEADCAEMREMRPWTYQVDYHGLAGIVHSLLFGKYLETIAERGGTLGAGATKTYRIRESLKRYWQVEIWSELFSILLNPLAHLHNEEGEKLPVLNGMKMLRGKMEVWLETNCEKGVGLKSMIKRLESSIRDRKK